LVLQSAAIAHGGEVMTLDMGEPVNIQELACRMIRLSGRVPYRDIAVVVTGPRPGEKLSEDLVDPDDVPMPSGHPGISISRPAVPDRVRVRHLLFELERLGADGRLDELAFRLADPLASGQRLAPATSRGVA